jgi:hypothetical protein
MGFLGADILQGDVGAAVLMPNGLGWVTGLMLR